MRYRPDIDGLRAVAVLTVVAFHAFPSRIPGGFVGVDVFFVISGYLITGKILQDSVVDKRGIAGFYWSRVRRIFPALLIVLIAFLFVGWWLLLADEYAQLGMYSGAGALSVANLVLWRDSGYFDGGAGTMPLLHLWSLGVEEQFYIFWPLIIWRFRTQRLCVLLVSLSFGGASLIFCLYQTVSDPTAAFYSPVTRLWELAAGGALACRGPDEGKFPNGRNRMLSGLQVVVGLLLIGVASLGFAASDPFPGWRAVLPVLGASLVIAADGRNVVASRLLAHRVMTWFGLISFPLYLWHWPLLSFAQIIEVGAPHYLVRLSLILLAIVLAWLTYICVEVPVRAATGVRHVRLLVVGAVSVALVGFGIKGAEGVIRRSAVVDSGLTPMARNQFVGSLWNYSLNEACLREYPSGDVGRARWWFCMKSAAKPPTIIILGTSYANQLYPGFVGNSSLRGHSVLSIGTCDFAQAESLQFQPDHPCFGDRVTIQRQFIDRVVERSPSIRFAIIDGLDRHPDEAYIERLRERITSYELLGIRVILFSPHVKPGFHPKACFSRPLRPAARDCTFSASVIRALRNDFRPVEESLSRTNPKVRVFDQNGIFCRGEQCSFLLEGIPLHRDEGHLSEFGSVIVQRAFTDWARREVPEIFETP